MYLREWVIKELEQQQKTPLPRQSNDESELERNIGIRNETHIHSYVRQHAAIIPYRKQQFPRNAHNISTSGFLNHWVFIFSPSKICLYLSFGFHHNNFRTFYWCCCYCFCCQQCSYYFKHCIIIFNCKLVKIVENCQLKWDISNQNEKKWIVKYLQWCHRPRAHKSMSPKSKPYFWWAAAQLDFFLNSHLKFFFDIWMWPFFSFSLSF